MKLLLRKDIHKLGLCGDIVDVSAGYARNYLLPHNLAYEPTKLNLKAVEEDKKVAAVERERVRAMLLATSQRLVGVEVTINAACNPEGHLYGSVGPREIAAALIEEGHSVRADQIKMSHNIKEVGTLEVPIVLSDDIRASVKVWVVAEKVAGLEDQEPGQKESTDAAGSEANDAAKSTNARTAVARSE
jgi:large subunit ribosomal protein L9